jgi:hypothetical protein
MKKTLASLLSSSVLALMLVGAAQAQDRFFTKEVLFTTAASIAARSKDAVKTCHNVNNGGREYWIPTQNCKVLATSISLGIPIQLAGQYFAYKHGFRKTERVMGYSWLGNVAGIVTMRINGR